MAIIELGIDGTYLSGSNGWSAADGIREIMQNAQDATVEHGGELKVSHENERLVIENTGAKLSRQALLIGNTTKRDRDDLIGQWGEGLKFGVLVLVRAGHKVTIRTGPEVWTPSIGASEKFSGAQVLKFEIEGGREDRRRVRVEIEGVSKDFWNEIRDNYLFLYKREVPQVETARGTVLTSEKFKGRVYVKGILTMTDSKLRCGYNLFKVELDRDRRVIGTYDLQRELRQIWGEALNVDPTLTDDFYGMLERRAPDVEGFYAYAESALSAATLDTLAAKFVEKFGADAVPVQTTGESQNMGHFGKTGVVVSEAMQSVLVTRLKSASKVKAEMAEATTASYGWTDLTMPEQQNLSRAVGLVCKALSLDVSGLLERVTVVDFADAGLGGLCSGTDIKIARSHLASRSDALRVLVHEQAHATTGARDGEKAHVAEIERTWALISEVLG
jgi:hypothetical protein